MWVRPWHCPFSIQRDERSSRLALERELDQIGGDLRCRHTYQGDGGVVAEVEGDPACSVVHTGDQVRELLDVGDAGAAEGDRVVRGVEVLDRVVTQRRE